MTVALGIQNSENNRDISKHTNRISELPEMNKIKMISFIKRSSRKKVFYKKGVLRKFVKFTGKRLCQRLFFNKVAGLRPATLLKKSLRHKCFPVNCKKFLRTPFFTEHLRWLLLAL